MGVVIEISISKLVIYLYVEWKWDSVVVIIFDSIYLLFLIIVRI